MQEQRQAYHGFTVELVGKRPGLGQNWAQHWSKGLDGAIGRDAEDRPYLLCWFE